MKNIFENAYFGKPYKTRDGRKAVFSNGCLPGEQATVHLLVSTIPPRLMRYEFDGTRRDTDNRSLDIVSEWQEEIDEEKLDKLAKQKYPPKTKYGFSEFGGFHVEITEYREKEIEAFKAGYRKAKE